MLRDQVWSRLSYEVGDELADLLQLLLREKQLAPMSPSINHFERGRSANFLISADDFMRLVDWHLRVLVAVQCQRTHWLEPRLKKMPDIELVDYREL